MEKYVCRSRSSTSLQRPAEKKKKKKKGFLAKALERWCWSLGRRRPRRPATAPPGCFVVLVGPERMRFAVRAERANHPLFRALLDEAEAEYGFPRPAAEPLVLPCAADEFMRVMSEVELDRRHEHGDDAVARGGAATAAVAGAAAPAPLSSPPAWSFFLKGGAARAGFQRISPGS